MCWLFIREVNSSATYLKRKHTMTNRSAVQADLNWLSLLILLPPTQIYSGNQLEIAIFLDERGR